MLVYTTCLLVLGLVVGMGWPMADPYLLQYPANWPKPAYDFSRNPLTKQGVALGRHLFYEPALSRDGTISCSSCHLSYTAFTHVDHALSHGINDRIGTRNSPTLMNLAWSRSFMWDGAVNHLDMQALAPIANPDEMGEDISHVMEKLQDKAPYPGMFYAAFGDSIITGEHLLKALAQFECTLISAHAKYDQVQEGTATYTAQEQNGYRLFQQNCTSCHAEPLFTSGEFARNGLPLDTILQDYGRMRISQQQADSMMFKIPTLRNIEFSHPYMHDGRFKTLREVLNHYTSVGTPVGKANLNANEKTDLIAFLLTLSDHDFLFNPDYGYPRE